MSTELDQTSKSSGLLSGKRARSPSHKIRETTNICMSENQHQEMKASYLQQIRTNVQYLVETAGKGDVSTEEGMVN